MSDYSQRMTAIELTDAARFIKRLAAEDAQLGLSNGRSLPPSSLHTPKPGVKRSGHYGANARRVRDRAHGAAAAPRTNEQLQDLANGFVPQSYLSIAADGTVSVVTVESQRSQELRATVSTSAQMMPETARHNPALRHDYN